ncbi:MAG: hypothetical protein FJ030_09100 [Chloroflexi bacterium]|nr:hypothetical protein [Chloroflexota bacterium]
MERLTTAAKQILGLDLTAPQVAAFRALAAELAEWNERFNLTAIKNPADVEIKHFADSLSCLIPIRDPRSTLRVIDIGSGAGFPGIRSRSSALRFGSQWWSRSAKRQRSSITSSANSN